MTRTTLEKVFRAASDEQHIERQANRIKHLEQAILDHKHGTITNAELYRRLGNCWEVDE